MSWYKTGTVNVTNGSNIVAGVGTQWANQLSGVSAGRMLLLQSSNQIEIYEIASVQSDTQLTLADNYGGNTAKGITYKIPTSPTISIEQFALEISSSLSYYQKQLDGWQKILTGTGDIELTAPDGRVVTIKSQKALTEAVNNSVKVGSEFHYYGYLGVTNISNFGGIQKGVYCQNLGEYALLTRGYPIQDAGSLVIYPTYAMGDQGCVQVYTTFKGARQFIRNYIGGSSNGYWEPWVEQITTTNIGKYIPIGDQRLMPFRRDELPFGWYFRNGDNYLLSSPQGQVLNGLSINYKNDHRITIKTINGQQYINVPTAFASDGRGFFERAVNGTARQVGSNEDDAIREIWGHFDSGVVANHNEYARGAFKGTRAINPTNAAFLTTRDYEVWGYDFYASLVVPTANENRPLNIGMTPVIYLGV